MAKCNKCNNEAVTNTAWGKLCEGCFLEVAEVKNKTNSLKTLKSVKKGWW